MRRSIGRRLIIGWHSADLLSGAPQRLILTYELYRLAGFWSRALLYRGCLMRRSRIVSLSLVVLGVMLCSSSSTLGEEERSKTTRKIGKTEALDPRFRELIASDAQIEVLADGFAWAEGPVWVRDGRYLLFSDIPKNSINKWERGKGLSLFMRPSGYTGKKSRGGEMGSNGLTLDSRGRLVLCEHGDRRVARLESLHNPNGPKQTLAHTYQGKQLNSPNDLVFHSSGALYFTDPPYGLERGMEDPGKELDFQGVYRRSPDGELGLLTSEVSRPNGIAFSPDEKTLYLANSDPNNPCWYAFDVQPDGSITNRRVFHDSRSWRGDKKGLPDGMKIDAQGNLFAAGPGGISVFAPDGTRLGAIDTTEPTANCTWGDDGSTLYITANKYLLRIRTKTKGLGM